MLSRSVTSRSDRISQNHDLSASYAVHSRLRIYTSIENILDQKYDASYGFPSLPRTARAGVRILLGGESPTAP